MDKKDFKHQAYVHSNNYKNGVKPRKRDNIQPTHWVYPLGEHTIEPTLVGVSFTPFLSFTPLIPSVLIPHPL